MLIDRADPFATAKPDARLIKLLLRARRFNAALESSLLLAGSGRRAETRGKRSNGSR